MIPDYVDIDPATGMVVHLKWPCDCEWDADAGQIICRKHRAEGMFWRSHRADPEANE